MEEDTNKSHPVENNKPAAEVSKREPLYELIGWKRNPPLVQLDLRGSKPFPLPSASAQQPETSSPPRSPSPLPLPPPTPPAVEMDVWIPRQDWVPPAAPTPAPTVKHADKVWIRRPTLSMANNSHNNNNNNNNNVNNVNNNSAVRIKNPMEENNPIYGRLWETSSSPNNSSRSSSCSAEAEEKPSPSSTDAELTGKFQSFFYTNLIFFLKRRRSKNVVAQKISYSVDGQKSSAGTLADDWNVQHFSGGNRRRRRKCN